MATLADLLRNSPTPIEWEVGSYNPNPMYADGGVQYFRDPNTGNLYTSNDESGQLLASGEALRNKDIQGLDLQYTDPARAQYLYDLKSSDPTQYASQVMDDLSNQINSAYRTNANYDQLWNQFASLKDQNPQEFYKNQLGFLGGQQGWQIGQNTSERNAAGLPAIQQTVEEAKAAGLSDNEINNILNRSSQEANIQNQNRIIRQQQSGGGALGLSTEDYIGMASVLAAAAGAAYFGPAMAAGGTGGSTGALTTAELMGGAGGAFTPTAGSGASFVIPSGATYGAAGAGSYMTPELMGPTYGELGYTGLEAGQMGPTYGEMGYTGLNQGEAIAQADAASKAAGGLTGMQKAQLVRMGTNALSQMSGGGTTGSSGGSSGSSGYNYASLPFLTNPQQNTIQMNTGADVSGSGVTTAGMPAQLDTTRHNLLMANLLRG